MTRSLNYYDLLMVKNDALPEEIEVAYRRLIRVYHPDANVGGRQDRASEITTMLNEARDTLLDPEARREYDAWLASPLKDEETEEGDLSPEEAAAADEAWQEEVRRHDEGAPGARKSTPSASVFSRLWPRRAPTSKRYFVATRWAWRVLRSSRAAMRESGWSSAIVTAILLFVLLVAPVMDLTTLPLIFFYLWPLPWDGRLLLPLAVVFAMAAGSPRLPVIEHGTGSGLFRDTAALTAFVEGHAWLNRLNTYLLAVEPNIAGVWAKQGTSPLLTAVLGPMYNSRAYPALGYALTALAALAIPYRLWRLASWLTGGRLVAGAPRFLVVIWRSVTAFGSALRAWLKPKGRAVVEVNKG